MAINPVLGKTTQLIHVFSFLNDKILKSVDHGLVTGMILIDLQKAFDAINHDILLKKLNIICFTDDTVKWFQSHLSNCKFTLNLENFFSEVSSISCGVPQESILGSLLFLIYVNNMPKAVKCNLSYLSLVRHCRIKFPKKSKERLT